MRSIDLSTPAGATLSLLPEIVLCAWALVVLLVVSWRHRTEEDSRLAGWLSLVGVILSGAALAGLWVSGARPEGLPLMMALDDFRFAAAALFLLAAALTILFSLDYMVRERMLAPEYYPLILLATAGMMFFGGAADLIVVFLGLEVMSVAVYVLAGYNRPDARSAEAALKYFLIGAFASGFLLYGIALVFGATGTTNLFLAGGQLALLRPSIMASLGLGLLLIGFAFKVAAVPFHMWAPDVYDGAPTPVTGFMATGVKAAAFVALARMLMYTFPDVADVWQPIVAVLAIATMVLGNLIALAQRSIKRMLAYSSVAHAGYLLVAIWPGSQAGLGAVLLYLFAYGLTTIAAFGILSALGRGGEREVTYDDLAGLAERRPWLAAALSVCMLSLLGFPGTLGFIGKWYILLAAVEQNQIILPVVLVLTSVVSAGYYLPVIMAMYMRPAPSPEAHRQVLVSSAAVGALAVSVAALLVFGFWPTAPLGLAEQGAASVVEPASPLAQQ